MNARRGLLRRWSWAVAFFARFKALLCRLFSPGLRPGSARQRRGWRAEDQAARFLKRKGYRILERNFRITRGEIDLVAFKDGAVVFVEVRSRTEPTELDPLQTITRTKQQRLIRAAYRYVALRELEREDVALRFDLIAIRYAEDGGLAQIRHIEGLLQE